MYVVDKPILKLIYKHSIIFLVVDNIYLHSIICLVVDNIYLLDNVLKLIYEWVIYVRVNMLIVVENQF